MTVRDNVALPLVLGSVQPKQITDKVNELAQLLGLTNHLDKYPYELSGGQQQRTGLCRALITNPKVVFADEPTGALDASMTSCFVLLCAIVLFVKHANDFFFKHRQKETGIYMLAGVSASRLSKVYALESALLGTMSLLIGLALGILLSKLFFMLLGQSIDVGVPVPLTVSPKAIAQVCAVFGTLFAALGYRSGQIVRKTTLLHMLHAVQSKPSPPRFNYFKGSLGVLLIAAGYTVATSFADNRWDFLVSSMATLVLVSLGTELFFGSFLSIALGRLIRTKRFIYKGVRLFSINQLFSI